MRLAIALLLSAGLVAAGETRTWTDQRGRKLEARLVAVEDDSVILELAGGRRATVALAALTPEDAEFARKVPAASAPQPDFDAPWPERVKFDGDPEISVIEEDAAAGRFVYESASYRYASDVRLSKSVVKGFAVMFEATRRFCRALPLGLDGGALENGKLPVKLFEQYDDYVKAGGPPGSAGVFIGGKGVVLVPLASLGVQPLGSGYTLDRDKSSQTLPHELTHQLTPHAYYQPGSLGWFTEGIAEYIAVTPYRSGAFSVRNNHKDIVDYVTGYGAKNTGGRALGERISLPPLRDFMMQSYGEFVANTQLNYGGALLVSHYFMQMDGDGNARRLKAFLRKLREGTHGEAALEPLLDGRTFQALEQDIAKAWKRRGVELEFAAAR